MLQYHISTPKHSTVPLFIWYVLLCVRCIVHTITCTTVTISHINNQTFYRSRVYTVYYFVFVVLYTESLVLMLQYHILATNHSTVPLFIRYIILCSLYCTHNHLYYCYNITYQQLNILPFPCLYDTLYCVRCIVHTITSTNVTISHINN
jgi:hypothetical protein